MTFGFPSLPRYIPGIGTSRRPEIASTDNIHDIILVPEEETVITCNQLLRDYGLFLGGSSATVFWAAKQYTKHLQNKNISLVVLSPDFGEKYIDTIYDPGWVQEKFGNLIKDRAFI